MTNYTGTHVAAGFYQCKISCLGKLLHKSTSPVNTADCNCSCNGIGVAMGTCNCSNISRGSNISQRLVNNLTICAVSRLMAKCGVVVCFRQFCCSGSSNKSAKKFHAPRLHPVPKSCSFCR
uniref:HDC08476 n=1 Tax=Drosophila melanogaster TaxID=7227 RepID=Q6ILS6_DROME|nr:TPA_inf: HDC08476 [Drosophila melanogaster]